MALFPLADSLLNFPRYLSGASVLGGQFYEICKRISQSTASSPSEKSRICLNSWLTTQVQTNIKGESRTCRRRGTNPLGGDTDPIYFIHLLKNCMKLKKELVRRGRVLGAPALPNPSLNIYQVVLLAHPFGVTSFPSCFYTYMGYLWPTISGSYTLCVCGTTKISHHLKVTELFI